MFFEIVKCNEEFIAVTLSSAGCPQRQMSQFHIIWYQGVQKAMGLDMVCVVLGLHFCITLCFGSHPWELGAELGEGGVAFSRSMRDPLRSCVYYRSCILKLIS